MNRISTHNPPAHTDPRLVTFQDPLFRRLMIHTQGYGPFNYMGDIGMLIGQVANNPLIPKKSNLFIVPSISATVWTPEDVWNTGIVGTYSNSLYGLAVERWV